MSSDEQNNTVAATRHKAYDRHPDTFTPPAKRWIVRWLIKATKQHQPSEHLNDTLAPLACLSRESSYSCVVSAEVDRDALTKISGSIRVRNKSPQVAKNSIRPPTNVQQDNAHNTKQLIRGFWWFLAYRGPRAVASWPGCREFLPRGCQQAPERCSACALAPLCRRKRSSLS